MPRGTVIKRPGAKFVYAEIGDELIWFIQDGHIVTSDRVMEIPK